MRQRWLCLLAVALAIGFQAQAAPQTPGGSNQTPATPTVPGQGGVSAPNDDPFPSTYRPPAAKPFAITNATILTAASPTIEKGTIVVRDGKIVAVGASVSMPADAEVIAIGRYVRPGIIDSHSHLGVYPAFGVDAHQDGNEMVKPNTAKVWSEHSV